MTSNLRLHERAVSLCREHLRIEFALIEVLQEIERCRLYRTFGCTSLFKYAVDILGMSESVAYAFILVARKASSVPELQRTLRAQSISVRKALRTVSVLNNENAVEVLEFAKTHTTREVDQEIARRQPVPAKRQSIKPISSEQLSLHMTLNKRVFEKLQRAQNLLGESELEKVLENVLDQFLDRRDPVRKAERAKKREKNRGSKGYVKVEDADSPQHVKSGNRRSIGQPVKPSVNQPSKRITFGRSSFNAHQRHLVHARDQGRCTYIDPQGKRCESERWLHLHHLKPVSRGGSNSPENIRTLCAAHHDLVHQLSFELKSPETSYLLV